MRGVPRVVKLQKADELFSRFLKEKQLLNGASPATIRIYSKSWSAFKTHGKADFSESGGKAFMIELVSSGLKPGSANAYARSVNSFLTWLFENEHTTTHLKIPLTSVKERVLQTYKPEDIHKIITYKPSSHTRKRLIAILFLLIDSGCRINEALTLKRKDIDWDNLLVTLQGKGNKQRRVPISLECRKALFRWLQTHNYDLVFCTQEGNKLRYDNLRRDFLSLLDAVGVEKTEGSFHAFRRFFGKTYIRNGGNRGSQLFCVNGLLMV